MMLSSTALSLRTATLRVCICVAVALLSSAGGARHSARSADRAHSEDSSSAAAARASRKQRATELQRGGRPSSALAEWDALLQQTPSALTGERATVLFNQAICHHMLGTVEGVERAVTSLDSVLALVPYHWPTLRMQV
jgi:hypothetical protein